MTAPLRIAILAHSTNPRGGVVHALELGDALTRLGHDATIHAPDGRGTGFFRKTLCKTVCVPALPAGPDTTAMVETRVSDYLRHFDHAGNRRFDVWHAQDGISGNALATLRELGLIPGFARTVHHVDRFADPRLMALQSRAIEAADRLLVVSRLWRDWLARTCRRSATLIGNGVDTARYAPAPDTTDDALLLRLGLATGSPVFLAVGGVEERKNTIRIIEAFVRIHADLPDARLVIAGGATLLDHSAYQARFAERLARSGLPEEAVIRTGAMPQAMMPALYRAASVLVFPSIKEGFGLVVLEAMASGVPVVTSRVAPFTEYLGEDDVVWCDPMDCGSIAAAMMAALAPAERAMLVKRGLRVARRHDWEAVANAHLASYDAIAEPAHA